MSFHTTTRRQFVTAVGTSGLAVAGTGVAGAKGQKRNFRAHLTGENEVPAVETNAQGQAVFQLNRNGDELRYKLIVANIEDVFAAHIHLGAADENGPVVTWLYPEGGPPPEQTDGRFDGVLAEATVTADDLVGPLDGASLDDLISVIEAENTYVNVHTADNTGGEVRGQIH